MKSKFGHPFALSALHILLAALLLHTSVAVAVPLNVGPGPGPGVTTEHVFQEDYQAWLIADLTDPIAPATLPVTLDAASGPWLKRLGFDSDALAAQGGEIHSGDVFLLQEFLDVASPFGFASWHEQILTPDWVWQDGAIFDLATSFPLSGIDVITNGALLDFAFDQLPPSSAQVLIVKTLAYVGTQALSVADATIEVQEYSAVPEPASASLLGLAALLATVTRRRLRG